MANRLRFFLFGKRNGRIFSIFGTGLGLVLFSMTGIVAAQDLSKAQVSTVVKPATTLDWQSPEAEPAQEAKGLLKENDPLYKLTSKSLVDYSSSKPIQKESSSKQSSPVRLVQYENTVPASSPSNRDAPNLGKEGPFGNMAPKDVGQGFFGQNTDLDNYDDTCPDPKSMVPITELSYKVIPQPGLFPESCPLPDEVYVRKAPTPITFNWTASNLCHKPLYFEDVQLERYGHAAHPLVQPLLSRARFWVTIPALPYFMGVTPPNECVYELGYYRPGSCAPHMLEPLPISLRGGLMQAGAIVGAAYVIP